MALKLEWRVSIQARVGPARDVGSLSPGKYKSFCVQISRAGIRKNEPNPIERETPQNLQAILSAHRTENGFETRELSEIALTCLDEFDEILACAQPGVRTAK